MGAWSFVRPRFECLIGKEVGNFFRLSTAVTSKNQQFIVINLQLNYVGRAEAATTATGIGKVHKREVEEIIAKSLN